MFEKKDIMDQYQILTELKNDSSVLLVKNIESNEIQVMKYKKDYNIKVIKALQEYEYAGIPKIYYIREEDDYLLTIEEYIHGKSLRQLYEQNGPFSEEVVLNYFLALCKIIKNLHNSIPPIIHRDIKPDNIILTNDQVIKLIDFDASKEEDSDKKQDTVLFGTHEYAAPEQYGFGKSDHRTDIYQIGITMNVLLTGQFPIHFTYEGDLGSVIRKCTEYDKEDRFSTIEDLEKALEKIYGKKYDPQFSKRSLIDYLVKQEKETSSKQAYTSSFMLPGFRSKKLWRMFPAICVYIFIIYVCATLEIDDSVHEGQVLTGARLWVQRFASFLLLLFPILLAFNYRGILGRIPGNNRIVKVFVILLFCALFFVLVVMILSIFESIYLSFA